MVENHYEKKYALIKAYFSASREISYCKQDIAEKM